nr:hypothetical protein [Nitrosopumilus sp.]
KQSMPRRVVSNRGRNEDIMLSIQHPGRSVNTSMPLFKDNSPTPNLGGNITQSAMNSMQFGRSREQQDVSSMLKLKLGNNRQVAMDIEPSGFGRFTRNEDTGRKFTRAYFASNIADTPL